MTPAPVLCGTCRAWVAPRFAQTAQGPWRFCPACGASMGPAPPPPVSADTERAWSQVALLAIFVIGCAAICVVTAKMM